MPTSTHFSTVPFKTRAPFDLAFVLALVAAVLVPVIFNPWGYHPFELPKGIVVRSLGFVAVLVLVVTVIEERRRRLMRPHLLCPALFLGVTLILATVFSIGRHVSLWGSYERQQGLLNLLALLALFGTTSLSLRTFGRIEILWGAIVWTSAPIVIYAFVQAAGLDPLTWSTDAASPVLSTVGRSNFLGSYLVLVLPLTAGRLLVSTRRWLYLALLLGQIASLALTQARGAWVGAGVAAVTLGLVWAVSYRKRKLLLAVLVLTAAAMGFVVLLNVRGGPLAGLAEFSGLDRLANLSDTSAGSSAARLTIWRSTLPLVARRPWLGYGPDTMRLAFAEVFPPQLVYYQGREVVVDRAHNLWLDLAMDSGLLGVLAFTVLMIGFARLCWRGLRQPCPYAHHVAWIVFASAVAGHLADMQVSFDTAATAVVFWLVLAMGVGLARVEAYRGDVPAASARWRGRRSPVAVAVVSAAFMLLIGITGVRPLLADSALYRSQDGKIAIAQRQVAARQAVRLWPYEPMYRLGLAHLEERLGRFEAAEAELAAAQAFVPRDPRLWAAQGDLYARWAVVDPSRLEKARFAYQVALQLSPNTAVYHTAVGMILAQGGQLDAAEAELSRAVALDATDAMAYRYLAQLYLVMGRAEDAARARHYAEEIFSPPTVSPTPQTTVRQD